MTEASVEVLNGQAQGELRSIIERLERLAEDRDAVSSDMREFFAEAKSRGFDTKIIRKVMKLRKQDKAKMQEEEALVDLYLSALGGL